MANIKEYKKGVPTQITKNFKSTEMDCKCNNPDCTKTYIDVDHIKKLQEKRDLWGKSIKITSGYRCEKHNKAVGGATHSRHRVGDATDIQVKNMKPDDVALDCEDFSGLGYYNTFTHIDSRPLKGSGSRWDFRKK